MEIEVRDTPSGERCENCQNVIEEPFALAVGVGAADVLLCWICAMEMADRAIEARRELANRLEAHELRHPAQPV